MAPTLSMRRVAQIASGPYYYGAYGRVVCCDSDHDSLPEIMFSTGSTRSWDPLRIEVWELSDSMRNEFRLVHVDTGVPDGYPVGIRVGNVIPFAAGDVDGDGLTDIVGVTAELDTAGGKDSIFDDVVTIEAPDSFSYPCSLSWHCRIGSYCRTANPTYYLSDLNGLRGILCSTNGPLGTCLWENAGDDTNALVWHSCSSDPYCAFGDFCGDGRIDFAAGGVLADVWENSGDTYRMVWRDTLLRGWAGDVFSTADIDGDGRSEFYLSEFNYPEAKMWLYMYEAESDGSHQFIPTLVDSLTYMGNDDWGRASACGDIDGDGIDECIWTTYDSVRIYKAFGDNDLRKVWEWQSDHHPPGFNSLTTTVYDVNNDGYNEMITAGNAKISVFEIDAVDLLSPNNGTYNVGDTVPIRWATHPPPRCDSLSLFLRRDSLWHFTTIATGLPGSDTAYRWVVPANVPDTGRIVVMAYGPGHQYDISDSVIHFIGGGVAEGTRVPLQWSLSVSPNPARGAFSVRYDVPSQARVSVGIYDADGRLVRSLRQGNVTPGRYEAKLSSDALPAGIYFLRLDTPGFRSVKKAVVTR